MSSLFLLSLISSPIILIIIGFIWFQHYRKRQWWEDEPMDKISCWFFTSILLCGLTSMFYCGYFQPSSSLSVKYNNTDGKTWTVVEHSMSGDSVILYNIRKPLRTNGEIVSKEDGSHFVGVVGKGGHSVHHVDIRIKLTDGRVFSERMNGFHDDLKIGHKVYLFEEFYPSYYKEIHY